MICGCRCRLWIDLGLLAVRNVVRYSNVSRVILRGGTPQLMKIQNILWVYYRLRQSVVDSVVPLVSGVIQLAGGGSTGNFCCIKMLS